MKLPQHFLSTTVINSVTIETIGVILNKENTMETKELTNSLK